MTVKQKIAAQEKLIKQLKRESIRADRKLDGALVRLDMLIAWLARVEK